MVRTFLLLGSGEFEDWTHDVEAKALAGAVGDGSVVILPTASSTEGDHVFERWGSMGLAHYRVSGVPAEVLPVKTRADANDDGLAARAGAASMIYFSGGKPRHLADVLRGTPLLASILGAVDRGAVYAGCSAGAMVASRSREEGGGVSWLAGLGLIPHVSFGVHWDRVRRYPGASWFAAARMPAGSTFVGIDERTAILGDGARWEVHGLGSVQVRRDGADDSYGAGATFTT
jgi:cyanophycinase